jgi:hypothetical protein
MYQFGRQCQHTRPFLAEKSKAYYAYWVLSKNAKWIKSSLELLLAPQAPFNLGDQVFGEAQVMKGLLQGLGGLLRLTAVTLQALPHCAAAALSGFGLLFDVSLSRRHSVVPSSCVGLLRLPSTQTFKEILDQAIAMLQRWGRLTYGTLKRRN